MLSAAILKTTPISTDQRPARLWMPKRVIFTPAALDESFGQQIYSRVTQLALPVETLKSNRLTGIRGENERETYQLAKQTMAVVTAPPSAFKLQPIPPSADFQFHLAEGCPAHCQYCYLAGSLQGPPVVRIFANLPAILENTTLFEKPGKATSFEASCYTDPLSLEHLTGSLSACIRHFGSRQDGHLRWVTKYNQVDSLIGLPHKGHTRCRLSLNAEAVARRMEGGTASIAARLEALRKLALPASQGGGNYPVGIVVAPIMPIPDWELHYQALLNRIREALDFDCDLTFELISHRFTPGSKDVLLEWYPNTSLDMDEGNRAIKYNKFGGQKYVYTADTMKTLRHFFETQIFRRFPNAPILYWT
jgi:spore photoproduct lyase